MTMKQFHTTFSNIFVEYLIGSNSDNGHLQNIYQGVIYLW